MGAGDTGFDDAAAMDMSVDMDMFRHLRFDQDRFDVTMQTRALAPDRLIEVDARRYAPELALKERILASDHRYYCQADQGTEAMQWEAIALILPNMACHYPELFALRRDGAHWRWANRLLGTETTFRLGEPESLPLPPLDWLGRQVQEDLCLLDGRREGVPLVAGHLCFAAGWCLDEMMGRSFLAIHAGVPLFAERIGRQADLLIQRLRPGRPVGRANWTLTGSGRLNLAPRVTGAKNDLPAGLRAAEAGRRCFLRSEWQTLSRLPETQGVLFTIHTTRAPLGQALRGAAQAGRLAALLRSMPAPMRAYKGLTDGAVTALVAYLEGPAGDGDGAAPPTGD